MTHNSNSLTKISFLIAGLILCGILGIFAVYKFSPNTKVKALKEFASQLGFTPDSQLAQYKACWGILASECGQMLFYSTSLTEDGFQDKLNRVTSVEQRPNNISVANLEDINLDSDHTLTITESSPGSQVPRSESLGYRWTFEEGGEYWIISFYEVMNDGYIYDLDGKPIEGNIVALELRLR